MRQIAAIFFAFSLLFTFRAVSETSAQTTDPTFLPTWRLLNNEQKQEFIAGYVKGFADAASIVEIAKEYIRENPKTAVASLESLKKVYSAPSSTPSELVSKIDSFYRAPENRDKPLSSAFAASR